MAKKDQKQTVKGSDFMKMEESDKVNLAVLIIFVACFLLGYFILIPKVNAYRDSKIAIENAKLQIETLETKAVLLNNLGEKLKEEDDFIKRTQDVLPVEPQVPELLLMIDRLAIENALYINTFSPSIEKDEKPGAPGSGTEKKKTVAWKTINLQFDVVGKYPNIKSFIKDLEQNIRPLDITNISISEGGDLRSEDTILRFHIGAKAYYQPK